MALIYDPLSVDHLTAQRELLGELYADAIWSQRAFEQQARNAATIARWRQSFPAWDRLFGRPALVAKPAPSAAVVQIRGMR